MGSLRTSLLHKDFSYLNIIIGPLITLLIFKVLLNNE